MYRLQLGRVERRQRHGSQSSGACLAVERDVQIRSTTSGRQPRVEGDIDLRSVLADRRGPPAQPLRLRDRVGGILGPPLSGPRYPRARAIPRAPVPRSRPRRALHAGLRRPHHRRRHQSALPIFPTSCPRRGAVNTQAFPPSPSSVPTPSSRRLRSPACTPRWRAWSFRCRPHQRGARDPLARRGARRSPSRARPVPDLVPRRGSWTNSAGG